VANALEGLAPRLDRNSFSAGLLSGTRSPSPSTKLSREY
jgi:hypothetical protein